MPRHEYSPHKRTRIAVLHASGTPIRALALQEGIPAGSVSGIIRRYRTQQSARSHQRSGRPGKLSEQVKNRIISAVRIDPWILPAKLLQKARVDVAFRTIQRALAKEGLKYRPAIQRPKLTEEHARKRLQMAQEFLEKPDEWWHRVVFSDETTVQRGRGAKRPSVWCKSVWFPPPTPFSLFTPF